MTTPFFMTHHAPVGAWAALTFGLPGRGIAIDHEQLLPHPNADLLIALHRDGKTIALPFIADEAAYPGWSFLTADQLTRDLTPCVDTFSAASAGITLKVFTPHPALPNPKRSGNLQYATVPGIIFELSVDNSGSDSPATAFIGLNLNAAAASAARAARGPGLRPLDWSSKTLCGVAASSAWALAAMPVKDEVFTLQARDLAAAIAAGSAVIEPSANAGGIVVKVAPRTQKTVQLVFAFFHHGPATQGGGGIEGRYLYSAYFPRVEAVANFLLANSAKILESCAHFDARTAAACTDPVKRAVFSQAVRAYEAGTQLIDSGGTPYFTVLAGDQGWRNALDLAVDHLPWELLRNPWVIRNLFDLATTSYSFHDPIKFPGDSGSADELRDGGMTFTHDVGYQTAYAPVTASPAGGAGAAGAVGQGAANMASEEVLNGIYLLTSYALLADDTPWAKTRLPFARELMVSLENRDHWDPEKRTGVLKAQSQRAGSGAEICGLAFLGESLAAVPGNLYLAVKTFCANMMLTTYYQANNDLHSADYSYAFAQKTAASIVAAFDAAAGILPANLLAPDTSAAGIRLIAALEPLAVPTYLGLTSTLPEYFPELHAALKTHALSCMKNAPEGCIDGTTGGLRLASHSPLVSPAKVASILFVLEKLFNMDVQTEHPSLWRELANWSQVAAASTTLADIVDVEKRIAVSHFNSGRLISSALFVKP